jgi:Family of unknown function (DUF6011)
MNTNKPVNELNDSLEDLFDRSCLPAQAGETPRPTYTPVEKKIERIAHAATQDVHYDRCKKCGGSGQYGRFGKCYACNGKGGKEFKTDAATRAKQQQQREERKDRARVEAHETYKANWPDAYAWMLREAPRFEFAQAMLEALTRFGSLTEKQQAAVDKCVARVAVRKQEAQARAETAPTVDASPILAAFDRARKNVITNEPVEGDLGVIITKNPTLRLAAGDPPRAFVFSPARKDPAIVYVREGEEYLGKITDGRFFRVRACDDATEARVLECAAQPSLAAKAYGLHYKCCGVCGRTLTNKASRERGIGPYCAERYGF